MQQITSLTNKTIKELKKLQQKKYRQKYGLYLIEGFHTIEEALKTNQSYRYLIGTADALAKLTANYNVKEDKVLEVTDEIASTLRQTNTSQSIFMVLTINQPKSFSFYPGKWVLLDNLTDPGNVGTIIRTADAAGYDGVILNNESVDLYNDKVQRAMQGSQFHITVLQHELGDAITSLKNKGNQVFASCLNDEAVHSNKITAGNAFALIIGNEAHGVSTQHLELADVKTYIPIFGQAESLNAAVAAGIIMYQFIL
ncbi:TrmH family RNA methyltransferase [Holzapfeliella floricola]|uniref:rRNA methyltransferase n=1 Tax=Holzapfeliella floricola DSM 23037 = JCM 16512 TaxID=1423744 RepID=A0A0R2DTQ6_9LACO|nr:RNA methyltransferase [Holzapfeliella floricola]KRN03884.1 rRNA methyltransferase [Holzapfeliella floricola DSM 23037 = JCM 16512]